MKIFLTGASGLVGSNVARVAERRGHEITAVVGSWTGEVPGAHQTIRLDLGDQSAVQKSILDLFPDAIVNAAAISSPASCDANPELSHHLNVDLPLALARLAHHLSARLIHLSSEQVFDGTAPPYSRDDKVTPLDLYGRQKVESEQLVSQNAPDRHTILRLPLLGGNSLTGLRSLNERLFMAWAKGEKARLFSDEIRQPCSAENVAEAITELLEREDSTGTFHWAGAEALSRAEMGVRVAKHFNLPAEELIETAKRTDDPASAKRQHDLSLNLAPLEGRLKTAPESFSDMLEKLVVPTYARKWFHSLGS
jgi:dTDP-4-dehydrorhamnose reductase